MSGRRGGCQSTIGSCYGVMLHSKSWPCVEIEFWTITVHRLTDNSSLQVVHDCTKSTRMFWACCILMDAWYVQLV